MRVEFIHAPGQFTYWDAVRHAIGEIPDASQAGPAELSQALERQAEFLATLTEALIRAGAVRPEDVFGGYGGSIVPEAE